MTSNRFTSHHFSIAQLSGCTLELAVHVWKFVHACQYHILFLPLLLSLLSWRDLPASQCYWRPRPWRLLALLLFLRPASTCNNWNLRIFVKNIKNKAVWALTCIFDTTSNHFIGGVSLLGLEAPSQEPHTGCGVLGRGQLDGLGSAVSSSTAEIEFGAF